MTLHSNVLRPNPATSPQRDIWTITVSLIGSKGFGTIAERAAKSVRYWLVIVSPSLNRPGGGPRRGAVSGIEKTVSGSGIVANGFCRGGSGLPVALRAPVFFIGGNCAQGSKAGVRALLRWSATVR